MSGLSNWMDDDTLDWDKKKGGEGWRSREPDLLSPRGDAKQLVMQIWSSGERLVSGLLKLMISKVVGLGQMWLNWSGGSSHEVKGCMALLWMAESPRVMARGRR